ncbi:DUF2238 domain-containing protein [Lentzea albidocapillata]|uniref:DUF2238 domain-containing protein n=1 Tax=Lentzea albidocapillata TaxID=40571 RepID=UPI003B84852D
MVVRCHHVRLPARKRWFEIVEGVAASLSGQAGQAHLGTQGDPLDTQWDMLHALAGAVLSAAARLRSRPADHCRTVCCGQQIQSADCGQTCVTSSC